MASAAGDPSSDTAARCRPATYNSASDVRATYVLTRGGVSRSYATVQQAGAAVFLSMAELETFA